MDADMTLLQTSMRHLAEVIDSQIRAAGALPTPGSKASREQAEDHRFDSELWGTDVIRIADVNAGLTLLVASGTAQTLSETLGLASASAFALGRVCRECSARAAERADGAMEPSERVRVFVNDQMASLWEEIKAFVGVGLDDVAEEARQHLARTLRESRRFPEWGEQVPLGKDDRSPPRVGERSSIRAQLERLLDLDGDETSAAYLGYQMGSAIVHGSSHSFAIAGLTHFSDAGLWNFPGPGLTVGQWAAMHRHSGVALARAAAKVYERMAWPLEPLQEAWEAFNDPWYTIAQQARPDRPTSV